MWPLLMKCSLVVGGVGSCGTILLVKHSMVSGISSYGHYSL